MGCGTSTMLKEKKRSSKSSKFSEYNEGNYYSLQDALKPNQGSVIDLTIKTTNRSKLSQTHDHDHHVASSSTTDVDISSRNSNHVFDDELPPRGIFSSFYWNLTGLMWELGVKRC